MTTIVQKNREVSLFGVRYPIVDGVRRSALNQIVPIVSIGDTQGEVKEEEASKWEFTNTHGGLGRYRFLLGGGMPADMFFDSSLRTDTGIITLLPNPTSLYDHGTAAVDMAEWNSSVYVVGGTYVRRVNTSGVAQGYCTSHSAWETVGSVHVERTITGNAVSLSAYNGKLIIWQGASGFDTYDGSTTWAHVATDGMYALTFDSQHVVVQSTGVLKKTTDLATFNGISSAQIFDATPTAMFVALDGTRNPQVHVGTTKGLFILDWTSGKVYPLQVAFGDAHADNCRGSGVWNGSVHYTKGGSVRSYQAAAGIAQVSDLGPNIQDGLPSGKVGRVVALERSLEHMLLAAVDAGTGTSSIFLWRGSGWHTLVEGSTTNKSIRAMCFTTAQASAPTSRLFYSEGTYVWWIPWFDTTSNPTQTPAGSTYKSTGKMTTPWFGTPELRQFAIDIRALVRKLSTTETASFEAAFDDDDSDAAWQTIGAPTVNGLNSVAFTNKAYPFRTVRLRVTLSRGSTNTLTPWLPVAKLRWTPQPRALFGWAFTIDATRPYGGRSAAELETALQNAVDAGVGLFSHRPADPQGDRTVRIKEMRDLSYTGVDHRGKWSCTVAELIPANEADPGMLWDGSTDWSGSYTWQAA